MDPTVNDFFCGAGGVALGFRKSGFNITWACDIDPFCIKTYSHNIGPHVIQADVTKLRYTDIPRADVWAFGFPCQDLSVAGQQSGFAFHCNDCGDEWQYELTQTRCPRCNGNNFSAATRSACFFEIMRLLDETQKYAPQNYPAFLFAENVKGLKPYIPALRFELEKRGFTVYTQLYNSKYWDVPQNRERYFIVAKSGKGQFIFPEEQHKYIPPVWTCLDKQASTQYYITKSKADEILRQVPHIHGIIIDDTYGFDGKIRVYSDYVPTLRATRQGLKVLDMFSPCKIRKLTPSEYGRLQAFPIDTGWEQVVSDTQAYKQFGNAVTVTVVAAIGQQIKHSLINF